MSAKRALGSTIAALGGLDAVVFTGGIGENSPRVRSDLAASLTFSGAHLDDEANRTATSDADVAQRSSAARILVVRAREDLVILRETLRSSARSR